MLDPRIAQGARSFAPDSPQDSMMRALQLITAQRQNALQQMQMQAYGEDRQAKQAAQQNALAMQNQQRNYLGSLDASQGPAMPFSVPNALAQDLPMDQIEALNKALGPRKVARVIDTANGQQQADDYGGNVGAPLPRYVAPQLVDQGNQKQFVTPTAGASFPVGMNPAQAAQDRRAREQLAQSQQQFNTRRADEAERLKFDRSKPTEAAGKPPTVEEKSASGYAARMVEAAKILNETEAEGRPGFVQKMAAGLPVFGTVARNMNSTPTQQKYRQAQEDWVRAKLRKESGAAIAADEMDREIEAYFPQLGENDPEVIAQKRRAREIANEAMTTASGRAAYTSQVPALPASAPSKPIKFLGFE